MVIAHQGGWDETAFLLVPLLIIATLLTVANRRANRVAAARKQAHAETDPESETIDDEPPN